MKKTSEKGQAADVQPERKQTAPARAKRADHPRAPAREEPSFPPDPGDHWGRVGAIAELMAMGSWRRGVTGRQLAKAWGVKMPLMRRIAAEASAFEAMVTGSRPKLVALYRTRLARIALEDGTDRVPAIRTALENLGELRQRHLVTPARDPVSEMTDEELQHYVATGEMPARLKGGNEP